MTDDAFYRPNRPPLPRRQPAPGEPIWTFRKDHVTWTCELRFHGETYGSGWEAQILCNGQLVIGRRFDLRKQAERWAEEERAYLERSPTN